MKRDMDLIRDILLQIENDEKDLGKVEIRSDKHTEKEISYHVMLLYQAGFIEALNFSSADGQLWIPQRLTWNGHEFLEAIRNDSVWSKIKKRLKDEAITLPLSIIGGLALELVKDLGKSAFGN